MKNNIRKFNPKIVILKTKYIDFVIAGEPLGEPEYTVLEASKNLLREGRSQKLKVCS